MAEKFEVRWDGQLAATPREVWAAITERSGGWLWPVEFEPRVGGTEHGLGGRPGTVTVWEPDRHFATSSDEPDGANVLDFLLEPRDDGTYLRYTHRGQFASDYDTMLDACRQHTDFYYHSLGEYVRHFAGRGATYVTADGPESSAQGGFAAWPAGVAHHLYDGTDGTGWSQWLDGVFADGKVA